MKSNECAVKDSPLSKARTHCWFAYLSNWDWEKTGIPQEATRIASAAGSYTKCSPAFKPYLSGRSSPRGFLPVATPFDTFLPSCSS